MYGFQNYHLKFSTSFSCDLSNNSNNGEALKKLRKGSLNTRMSRDISDDLFIQSLKDPECVAILLNCVKTEKQITNIFSDTIKLKEKQIKGESHLQEVSNAVDFVTKKFDPYKQERKKGEKTIISWQKLCLD